MRIVQWIFALSAGVLLMALAGITLGIESGLPLWRAVLGLLLASCSLLVMDKWLK